MDRGPPPRLGLPASGHLHRANIDPRTEKRGFPLINVEFIGIAPGIDREAAWEQEHRLGRAAVVRERAQLRIGNDQVPGLPPNRRRRRIR